MEQNVENNYFKFDVNQLTLGIDKPDDINKQINIEDIDYHLVKLDQTKENSQNTHINKDSLIVVPFICMYKKEGKKLKLLTLEYSSTASIMHNHLFYKENIGRISWNTDNPLQAQTRMKSIGVTDLVYEINKEAKLLKNVVIDVVGKVKTLFPKENTIIDMDSDYLAIQPTETSGQSEKRLLTLGFIIDATQLGEIDTTILNRQGYVTQWENITDIRFQVTLQNSLKEKYVNDILENVWDMNSNLIVKELF